MNETIERLAREAGIDFRLDADSDTKDAQVTPADLNVFAHEIANLCATIADDSCEGWNDALMHEGAKMAANAIRKRFGRGE